YDIHYPNEERQAGRPLRMAPTYDRLRALGAAFGEKSGWERPNWFEPNADDPRFGGRSALDALRPRGWAGEHWSPAIAAEALAPRLLRAVGSPRPRHPHAAVDRRPVERGIPVPDQPPDHARPCAGPGTPGDVCRRAGLGAVRPCRVRRRPLGHGDGRRAGARP